MALPFVTGKIGQREKDGRKEYHVCTPLIKGIRDEFGAQKSWEMMDRGMVEKKLGPLVLPIQHATPIQLDLAECSKRRFETMSSFDFSGRNSSEFDTVKNFP